MQLDGWREGGPQEACFESVEAVVLMSVLDAAQSGDRRKVLEQMRDTLAAAMDAADPAVQAQISGQLRQVLKDLAELPEVKAESPLEQAKKARAARRSNLKAV